MGDVSYKPLISQMTWSYSRIRCFDDCPYRFFLKYIYKSDEIPMFYSSYGKFMHKLLEQYYKGEITKEEMKIKFLFDFKTEVKGERPKSSTVEKYIKLGIDYLNNFEPFPYDVLAVEEEFTFKIGEYDFIGYIDYLGERDGDLYIIDNKSRDLKPRSKRANPTVKDIELDEMLKQLYVYAEAVRQKFGKLPQYLCFNCFKSGVFIKEKFDYDKYQQTLEWVQKCIRDIEDADDFHPNKDYFGCKFICAVNNDCCFV